MIDSVYWVWIQLLFGFGTARAHKIMEEYSSPEELYEKLISKEIKHNFLFAKEKEKWQDAMEKAKEIQRITQRKGCEIVTPDHPDYPPLLNYIYAKPAALYVKGDLSCVKNSLNFTIVGARRHSKYGGKATYNLAHGLASGGATVISGLAFGIDTVAHTGAVEGGGQSVGVLACGLDIDYPRGNSAIKSSICEGGAVISEYPMGMEPRPYMFPPRNRIMAGMSHGVIVVEASDRSGSLITARHATDSGRDVFVVPGSMFAGSFVGSHRLIREGAKLVTNIQDILEEYPLVPKETVEEHFEEIVTEEVIQETEDNLEESFTQLQEEPIVSSVEEKLEEKILTEPISIKEKEVPDTTEKADEQGINTYVSAMTIAPDFEKKIAEAWQSRGVKVQGKKDDSNKDLIEIRIKQELPEGIEQEVETVYNSISDRRKNADQLTFETGLPVEEVLGALTTLELLGFVQNYPGGFFTLS